HAIAKEETLKTSNGHSKPKTKKTGSKRLVMLDPGHGGIDTGATQVAGSLEEALNALDLDREFLKAGGVFTDEAIDAYIALRREE
ncbi:hypothetical protein MJM95_29035, partial [Salmonella enterica subsp. enterica serovar Anatum]|nr:hypothetical protein [Salmonella enterica subsp. enterica serovar Anatum]